MAVPRPEAAREETRRATGVFHGIVDERNRLRDANRDLTGRLEDSERATNVARDALAEQERTVGGLTGRVEALERNLEEAGINEAAANRRARAAEESAVRANDEANQHQATVTRLGGQVRAVEDEADRLRGQLDDVDSRATEQERRADGLERALGTAGQDLDGARRINRDLVEAGRRKDAELRGISEDNTRLGGMVEGARREATDAARNELLTGDPGGTVDDGGETIIDALNAAIDDGALPGRDDAHHAGERTVAQQAHDTMRAALATIAALQDRLALAEETARIFNELSVIIVDDVVV